MAYIWTEGLYQNPNGIYMDRGIIPESKWYIYIYGQGNYTRTRMACIYRQRDYTIIRVAYYLPDGVDWWSWNHNGIYIFIRHKTILHV